MEITRNQYYMAGLVLLFLGIQFRMIESVELKEQFATFIAERTDHPLISVSAESGTVSRAKYRHQSGHAPTRMGRMDASLPRRRLGVAQLGDAQEQLIYLTPPYRFGRIGEIFGKKRPPRFSPKVACRVRPPRACLRSFDAVGKRAPSPEF